MFVEVQYELRFLEVPLCDVSTDFDSASMLPCITPDRSVPILSNFFTASVDRVPLLPEEDQIRKLHALVRNVRGYTRFTLEAPEPA